MTFLRSPRGEEGSFAYPSCGFEDFRRWKPVLATCGTGHEVAPGVHHLPNQLQTVLLYWLVMALCNYKRRTSPAFTSAQSLFGEGARPTLERQELSSPVCLASACADVDALAGRHRKWRNQASLAPRAPSAMLRRCMRPRYSQILAGLPRRGWLRRAHRAGGAVQRLLCRCRFPLCQCQASAQA